MGQAAIDESKVDGRDARWDDHRQGRHERILTTAIAMIDAGNGDAGVAAIAAEAQVPRSVVYRLFKDREDLDEQIRQRIVAGMVAELAPTLELRGTVRTGVRRVVATYVAWVQAHAELHRFLGAGSSSHPERGSAAMIGGKAGFARRAMELIDAYLAPQMAPRKVPRGLVADLANGLVGMIDSAVNGWLVADPAVRSSPTALSRFLAEAACGQILGAASVAGIEIDLDRRLSA
ncbi:TetR/AcrR family transcriptional regulator [Nocardioides caeni]|uniref:TetR family transcriptional regulator n=1 Tax=Nocardioides caeni TaxID=574700 RepID=A0A4S8NMC5_9ACTN|nr:TetR family transcriptional regulator [Nocardioides caeni]THV16154.1 TetR family transcriptional regulator [Nocardioides caeni]